MVEGDSVSPPGVMLLGTAWAVTAEEYLCDQGDRGYCAAYLDLVTRFDLGDHSLYESILVRHPRSRGVNKIRVLDDRSIPFTIGG